jgi:cyclopropane-fatty-acyl-phospholipid synthase
MNNGRRREAARSLRATWETGMNQVGDASTRWASRAADERAGRSRLLDPLIANIRHGRLRVRLPNGAVLSSPTDETGPQGLVSIKRWRALRRLALGGAVGFAESYVDGDWASPDLTALLRLAARNLGPIEAATRGLAIMRIANRLRHHLRGNTRRGSRRNIMAHYDLGNPFYALWLDPSMQYSSALWSAATPDLEAAQSAKLKRVVDLLDLGATNACSRSAAVGANSPCGWRRRRRSA